MGIARGAVKLLMQEGLRKSFQGDALTLGKQDVWITQDQLEVLAKELLFPLSPADQLDPLSLKPEFRQKKLLSDVYLFTRLGFHSCRSLDYSSYENADWVFDLNQESPPHELLSAFSFIFDGGTIEHVFHLPNTLRNLYSFLAPLGRIFHLSPSSNHIDHGFYMFSPTFFWDFYQANQFEINELQVIKHTQKHNALWKIFRYKPGSLNDVSYGGLDGAMYAIQCIATKTQNSTGNRIPQQRNYVVEAWEKKQPTNLHNTAFSRLKTKLKQCHPLYQALLFLYRLAGGHRQRKLKMREKW